MLRASSTWRSSLLLGAVVALLPAAAEARLCWPAVLDNGLRLQRREPMPVQWLPLLFRQHEVCSRRPERAGELRVFVTGSSGIYGFPLGPDQAVSGILNARRTPAGPPVHFYNLGHLFTYQVKDALIVRESLGYQPDLIVHALVLSDFVHRAPVGFPGVAAFLRGNRGALAAFAEERPPGLVEPLALIREAQAGERWPPAVENWRQTGRFVRMTAEANAHSLLAGSRQAAVPSAPFPLPQDDPDYDCTELVARYAAHWESWREWNILAYLESVRNAADVPIVVVNWPVAERPRGRCYSARFPRAELRRYFGWVRREAGDRGLPLLEYQDLLRPDEFFDSIHPNAAGQRKIARQLEIDLAPLLVEARTADAAAK